MLNRLQAVFLSLHRHNVRYLVIGGIAAVVHGVPRATFDLDILIDTTLENAELLLVALRDAELGTAFQIEADELLSNEITIFQDRVRIDVQTRTPGLNFADAWKNKEIIHYRDHVFYVVSREDLVKAKRASGRNVDLEDISLLELNQNSKQE